VVNFKLNFKRELKAISDLGLKVTLTSNLWSLVKQYQQPLYASISVRAVNHTVTAYGCTSTGQYG